MDDNFKHLPPEERIKKLKELEEKKNKEIEEAKKLIKESEEELTAQANFKVKVPIPQVAIENLKNLSAEEKEILKTHKGLKEKVVDDEDYNDDEEETNEELDSKDLEQLTQNISPSFNSYLEDSAFQYIQNLAQQPVKTIYQEMNQIHQVVEEKGYINREEEQKVTYLSSAVEMKMADLKSGKYSLFEEVGLVTSLSKQIQQMSSKLRDLDHN